MMDGGIVWMGAGFLLILLILGALVATVVFVLPPLIDFRRVMERLAHGDHRAVISTVRFAPFRKIAFNLQLIAEQLRRGEEQLAEEERSLRAILGSMAEGVIITGPDLRIRLANDSLWGHGLASSSIVGGTLLETFRNHELQELAQRALALGEMQQKELVVARPGHPPQYFAMTAAPLRGGLGVGNIRQNLAETSAAGAPETVPVPTGVMLVLDDVTRLRELEAMRREFVANVSHEFRTPLSIIQGYLETLQDGAIDNEEMAMKAFQVMQKHCHRLNLLIDDLLIISSLEEKSARLEFSPSNVPKLLEGILAEMELVILERGATVSINFQEGTHEAEVDRYRLEQAFTNLLANALQHGAPVGGIITIVGRAGPSTMDITIRDNGPGIPLQDQSRLFERFYRVGGDRARRSGGTGLGLSIVSTVVMAHGGQVRVESTPGHGAAFTLTLPLRQAKR